MTRARDLARLGNSQAFTVDTNLNVGIGSATPEAKLDVVGIVSATSFYGDGTNLSNTGSLLSAASGTQRIVVTGQTSGTMTASATDADLTFDATTNTLSVPQSVVGSAVTINSSGINVTGVVTSTSSIVGSAVTINSSGINVTGVVTSTSSIVGSAVTINSSGISATSGIVTVSQVSNAMLVNYSEKINALGNTGASKNINVADGTFATATLDQSTTFTFTSPENNKVYGFSLLLTNGAGGPFSITWPGSVKWPNNTTPVRTTADGKSDIWVFTTINGGTTWYGYIGIYDFS